MALPSWRRQTLRPVAMAICAAVSLAAAAAAADDAAGSSPDEYVALHNAARAAAGAGPVEWDGEAARHAGERAAAVCAAAGRRRGGGSQVAAATSDSPVAAATGEYGENVFRGAPGKKAWAAADAVRAWTAPAAREHAQVVWPNSTSVGCARAVCGGHGGGVVITCSYQPPVKEELRRVSLPQECRFNISRCVECPIC